MVSRAQVPRIEEVKKRFGWSFPWYSCFGTSFHEDFVTSRGESFGLSVFFLEGERIFQTYFTSRRGVEHAGNTFELLDLAPFGRQEKWEVSPEGWPQDPTYTRLRLHDEYGR